MTTRSSGDPLRLLVLGATGPTGRQVVERALARGDEVTALCRRPEALAELADRIEVAQGDATSTIDVASTAVGCQAVVAALGRGHSTRARGLFSDAATAVVSAAEAVGIQRLVWLSSFGVGATLRDATPVQRLMYRTLLRDLYADKARSEVTIRSSSLDWTLIYPTALTNGPVSSTYRVGESLEMRFPPRVSRADVADLLCRAVHDDAMVGRGLVITD